MMEKHIQLKKQSPKKKQNLMMNDKHTNAAPISGQTNHIPLAAKKQSVPVQLYQQAMVPQFGHKRAMSSSHNSPSELSPTVPNPQRSSKNRKLYTSTGTYNQ